MIRNGFSLYSLVALVLLLLSGCSDDMAEDYQGNGDDLGPLVTLDFSVGSESLRASGMDRAIGDKPPKIESMELWVFDSTHIFIERAKAFEIQKQSQKKKDADVYKFKVTLHSSNTTRYVHFVANYSLSDENFDKLKGRTESYIFSSLKLSKDDISVPEKVPMWAKNSVSSITPNTTFKDITMLPCVSYLGLQFDRSINSADFEPISFAVIHEKKHGTIAPFVLGSTNADIQFDTTALCAVPEDFDFSIPSDEDFVPFNERIMLFDQSNDPKLVTTFPYIILKANVRDKKTGAKAVQYFKLDIVDIDDSKHTYRRYDLKRGKGIEVCISGVVNTNSAVDSPKDAMTAQIANNLSFAPDVLESPIMDDGKQRIKVERTFWVSPESKGLNGKCWVNYFLDLSKDKPGALFRDMANSHIACYILNPDNNKLIKEARMDFDSLANHCNILVNFNDGVYNEIGQVVAYVKDNPKLKRIVQFVRVGNYNLKYKISIPGPLSQITEMVDDPDQTYDPEHPAPIKQVKCLKAMSIVEMRLSFPHEIHKFIFPIKLRFFTNELYPVEGQNMLAIMDKDNPIGEKFSSAYYYYNLDGFEKMQAVPGEGYVLTLKFRTVRPLSLEKFKSEKGACQIRLQTDPRDLFTPKKNVDIPNPLPDSKFIEDYYYYDMKVDGSSLPKDN